MSYNEGLIQAAANYGNMSAGVGQGPSLGGLTLEEMKERQKEFREQEEKRINMMLRAGVVQLVVEHWDSTDVKAVVDVSEQLIEYIKNGYVDPAA